MLPVADDAGGGQQRDLGDGRDIEAREVHLDRAAQDHVAWSGEARTGCNVSKRQREIRTVLSKGCIEGR